MNTKKDNTGLQEFKRVASEFNKKYEKAERKIKLNDEEKLTLIKSQDNKCTISGAPIFQGDDIEIDHFVPLAIGGSDSIDNLNATHKDENRKKGSKVE